MLFDNYNLSSNIWDLKFPTICDKLVVCLMDVKVPTKQ